MRPAKKFRRNRVLELEKALWEAGRRKAVRPAFPEKGLAERVLTRIRRQKEAPARKSFLETLGYYSWRLAPVGMAILILAGALEIFLTFRGEDEWPALLTGGDTLIRWMLGQGGKP